MCRLKELCLCTRVDIRFTLLQEDISRKLLGVLFTCFLSGSECLDRGLERTIVFGEDM